MTASRIACFALAGVVGSFVSAHAALLGVSPGFPTLVYDNSGVMTYDSATDLFVVDAFPLAIRFTPVDPPVLVLPTGSPATERVFIQIHVDESGALSGGVAEADLAVIGQVDQDGDSVPDFTGVLLAGEAAGFGFQEGSGPTALFDFRFVLIGGTMASEFGGGTIGVLLTSESSTFPGGFTSSFSGFSKGNIGPIAFQCGDGFVDGGEQCDDGADNSDTQPDACRTDCTLAGCGDEVVDTGEQCDDGADNSDTQPDACRTDCTLARCGDEVVDTGEQCDDGNNDDDDNCSNSCVSNVRLVGCRITGGWYVSDGRLDPGIYAEISRGQGGGQVGAPCGCIGCLDEFDHIKGQWQYSRKHKKGNFQARTFNSLICGCDQDGACNSNGVNGSAFTNPAAFNGQLCNPVDPEPGPEPRPSPANVACFSGIGGWTPANGRREIPVAFRVEVEDRGEPAGDEDEDGTCDVYQIRIWVPGKGETAAGLADDVCCIDGYDTINPVRSPNIQDGGNLVHGNIQIHPQTPNSQDGTCPLPDDSCPQP